MTAPGLATRALFDVAKSLGCQGVELRNDLAGQPFDGDSPDVAQKAAKATGLSIYGLAEIKSFNRVTEDSFAEALMGILHETGHALYEQGLPKDWNGSAPTTAT